MGKIVKILEVPIADLAPYANNAKMHSAEQVEKIAESIREFGFLSPLLIDDKKNVIAGHGRIMAAKRLGLDTVPCVSIEGLTEEQRRAYILADNRLTELGDWDRGLVSQELEALKESGFDISITGFNIDDIIITDDMGAEQSEEAMPDFEAVEPRIHRGEVWLLGNHRLMCGDSTKVADVQKLMNGAQADLLVTDPPYGVSYVGKTKDALTIENDEINEGELQDFLTAAFLNAEASLKAGAAFYIWYASRNAAQFIAALNDTALEMKQQIIWVKNVMVLGRQDYQWRHEPCLYGWKKGGPHYFIDLRSLTTVQEAHQELTPEQIKTLYQNMLDTTTTLYEDKPSASEIHPTMKPVPLFQKLIRNSSREGDKVLDLFGGSGTTIIACEEMNRAAFVMEYDEKYAESIIQRWEEATGREAVKEQTNV